jgi:hypothetical protein
MRVRREPAISRSVHLLLERGFLESMTPTGAGFRLEVGRRVAGSGAARAAAGRELKEPVSQSNKDVLTAVVYSGRNQRVPRRAEGFHSPRELLRFSHLGQA